MWNLRSKWWKLVLSIVIALVVDIGLHFAWAPSPEYKVPVSYFVKTGWFLPIVTVLLLLTYLALALIFQLIQAKLPGTKLTKGLIFGAAFGGLMFVSSPAMSLLFGSPLIAELRIGFVDGCAICLLGVLLGCLTAADGVPRQGAGLASLAVSVIVVGLVYFALHFLVYLGLPWLFPANFTQPTEIFLWTLGVGLWIGVMNWMFQSAFATGSFARQSLEFAGVAFGIFSLINTLFAPVFVAAPTGILLLNSGVGILCAGVSVWLARIVQRQLLHVSQ